MRWGLNSPRTQASIIAIVLAYCLSLAFQNWWLNYWVLKDGQTTTALVIRAHWRGHGKLEYSYLVKEKEYKGYCRWRRDSHVTTLAGGHNPVFFSASHPWLSSLYRPDEVLEDLPVVLLLLLLEAFAVATLIQPKSRWAFRFGSRKHASVEI
jgi:hypothetical protein